ncbi:winged helix-turn-helix transcriptional regulator [Cohnella suwonensis]|uniref:Winged helix-turn-helix transcriptional regulator n=1 Tax=Cohnella suwonensis TaxID=696072 RepID=A0ABW0LTS6_9BACL
MESSSFVQRMILPLIPPKVEYVMTRFGETLMEPLNEYNGA